MDCNNSLIIAVGVLGTISLAGFFFTKTKGFGRFATSAFLMLLVIFTSGLFFAANRLDAQIMANIFFAVIGFAGGLVTRTDKSETKSDDRVGKNFPD